MRVLLALAFFGVAAAIYPDDLWDHSTKVTSQTQLDELVKMQVDAGKTLMVRWIASEG